MYFSRIYNIFPGLSCNSRIFHVFPGMGVSVLPSGQESLVAKRKIHMHNNLPVGPSHQVQKAAENNGTHNRKKCLCITPENLPVSPSQRSKKRPKIMGPTSEKMRLVMYFYKTVNSLYLFLFSSQSKPEYASCSEAILLMYNPLSYIVHLFSHCSKLHLPLYPDAEWRSFVMYW